ncbi:molybdopterin converting factor subunit 1 [Parvibium lacunae]|uniref:Molybdopterin synthase sulfur carrier subunit n=1 Tax=Parvibium lacunae TaxID=1888893 RepID=A0A368L782_9BURK|nr:molybdopterin converting factor subunit 1 [Parvibium lacunae]RCS59422.1 molybdopterin converting factor subunit 1 [Parvibium lacunae]
MTLTIKYFASLREALNCAEERVPHTAELATVQALKAHLQTRGEPWQSALANPQLRCAVNQEQVPFTHPLQAGDEIAFFPPVTGG